MTSPLYIDIHVLQTVPPSNLNRDDAGSPKQAVYGGVRRARVSSQSWKRATRMHFADFTPSDQQATRTKGVATLLTDRLVEHTGLERDQAYRVTATLLKPLNIKPGKKEDSTAYLLFFGRDQIDRIAARAAGRLDNSVAQLSDDELSKALADISAQEDLMNGHPLEVALFGRMVADLAALNVDAAVQVAHSISTHAVEIEFDYFTAVDDEKDRAKGDDVGAAMIGTVEFNSATLYRYATVAVHQLVENLGGARDAAVDAVQRFVDGFVRAMPTGHQNAFAHRTLPDAVVVVARDDQPVNLVSAFEEPVRSSNGYMAASLRALVDELEQVERRWGRQPRLVASTYRSDDSADSGVASTLGPSTPFDDLLAATATTVQAHLAGTSS